MSNIYTSSLPIMPISSEKKKIYIIRHGETEFNKLGLVQGSGVDTDLNDTGRYQAKCFYDAHKHLKFDKVYTSALRRTHQTVHLFLKNGIAWETLKGLNEISWGNKEGKILTAADDIQHHAMISGWKNGELHLKSENGESPIEVQQRQKRALSYIMNQTNEQNILICMHGRAMRIFLSLLLGKDMRFMDNFEHSNLSLYMLEYKNGKFELKLHNDRRHLEKQEISQIVPKIAKELVEEVELAY